MVKETRLKTMPDIIFVKSEIFLLVMMWGVARRKDLRGKSCGKHRDRLETTLKAKSIERLEIEKGLMRVLETHDCLVQRNKGRNVHWCWNRWTQPFPHKIKYLHLCLTDTIIIRKVLKIKSFASNFFWKFRIPFEFSLALLYFCQMIF